MRSVVETKKNYKILKLRNKTKTEIFRTLFNMFRVVRSRTREAS